MTNEQTEHLDRIKRAVAEILDHKYTKGQHEHGGNLYDMPVEVCLINDLLEHIDGLTYTLSALEQLGVPVSEVIRAIHEPDGAAKLGVGNEGVVGCGTGV